MTYEDMALVNRRHEVDPHPPPGCHERRHCSDRECQEAREKWFMSELLPKLTNRFWIGVAGTVLTLAGANYYIMQAMLNRHELAMFEVFEKSTTHDEDIREMKETMKELSGSVQGSLNSVLLNQGKILDEVRTAHRK